jgi:hypothetical protein
MTNNKALSPPGVLALMGALGGLMLLAGCGDSQDGVPVYPARGTVLYQGAPAEGAKVVLYDTNRQDPKAPFPTGEVQPDGTFRLTSYEEGDGAPAGTYKVTITWLEPIPEGVNREMYSPADRLGGRYANPEQSPLEVTIVEGNNELEPLELK